MPHHNAVAHHQPPVVTLEQWRPAFELQALCRIARVPHHVINSGYPLFVSTGDLPQLRCGSVVLGGARAVDWMRKVGCGEECSHFWWKHNSH